MKVILCIIFLILFNATASEHKHNFHKLHTKENIVFQDFFHIPPSVQQWQPIDTPKQFTVISMKVDHHSESPWYIPALHGRHSIGWNRTSELPAGNRPYACTIRFLGVGLESTLEGYQSGGTGYLTLGYKPEDSKKMNWFGFDKNETNKIHCYYITNKDTGSEFLDAPKTLGLAIHCPITLDQESGPFIFRNTMSSGSICRPLSEYYTDVEVHLRPSDYPAELGPKILAEVIGDLRSNPTETRMLHYRTLTTTQPEELRHHGVCTVQTFKNPFTGPMLYMFVLYYQLLGWRVIVYDRFGLHYDYIKELLTLPGVDYYPFTVMQLAHPSKYNTDYLVKQGTELKSFYKMEVNWGYSSKKIADTPDQDADKTRTYDYARLEYTYLETILYIDADEFFYCPSAGQNLTMQKEYQQRLHSEFIAKGIEEMRYVRIPYSGLAPDLESGQNRSIIDFTNHTGHCMIQAYEARSIYALAHCWSQGSSYDNFQKSADLAGVCPFHYNHWSCDGMKGGGRDFTKVRCRCKVGLEMQNFYLFHPMLKNCHLMHFNDNKYRFQARRTKHQYDKGEVTMPSVLVDLFAELKDKPQLPLTATTAATTSPVHHHTPNHHHPNQKKSKSKA